MTFPIMLSKGRVLLWSATFVLLWAAPAHAADFTGPVVSVLDGDTIEVLHNTRPERVRHSGIDYPKKYHHFSALDLAPSFGSLQGAILLWFAAHDAFGRAVSFFSSGFMSPPRTLKDVSRSVLSKLACAVILSPLRPNSVGVATTSHNAIVKTSAARWKMPRPIFHPNEDPS